jgi:hypothetical protein
MAQRLSERRAVSAVLSVLLLVVIVFVVGIFFYNVIMGNLQGIMDSSSVEPFSLFIGNVAFNKTCMTLHVINSCGRDAVVEVVYVNDEPFDVYCFGGEVIIPAEDSESVYVWGSYTSGCLYEIKIVFSSGYSLYSMDRY